MCAFPSAGYQSGSARVGRPCPSSWLDCWLSPGVAGSGRSRQVVRAPFVEQSGCVSDAQPSTARCASPLQIDAAVVDVARPPRDVLWTS